jgi:hypothetical protein
MRWDAAISGRLVIPAQHRQAWLAAELDWKSVTNHQVLKGYISGETVRDMVDGVDFVEATEFLEIRWVGDEIQLRSFQGQAGFNESMVGFAAAWAAAAAFGGVGELLGFGMIGTSFGYRLSVEAGEASVIRYPEDQPDALADHPDIVAVRERMASIGGAMNEKLIAAAAPRPIPKPARVAAAPVTAKPAKKASAQKKPSQKKPSQKKPSQKKPSQKKPT